VASEPDRLVSGDPVVVWLTDENLRDGIASLRWGLDGLLSDGQSTLVIDLGGVERVSAPAIAAMLWAKRRCLARRVDLVVRNPNRRTLEMLRRTGLESALTMQTAPAPRNGRQGSRPPDSAAAH
jgi:hypothetical protein